MQLQLATWNINSVRLRLALLGRLAAEARPDVICLQETKARDEHFPHAEIEALGYRHRAVRGMPGYNGVAILSRVPLEESGSRDWCGLQDCRHVYARLPGGVELHNFYVPAGGDEPDPDTNPKFAHKLRFLDAMAGWFRRARSHGRKLVLVGDLNIAPLEQDVWSHKQLLDVVSHTPIEVEKLGRVQASLGWVDAIRHFVPPPERLYSWWSYRARDWAAADRGRRLDHIWVTPDLVPRLGSARILRSARGWAGPSDHVPVLATLSI
ncbi:MAG: exodeoxyribonuclease III [Alphaproteobacteria bacterium]